MSINPLGGPGATLLGYLDAKEKLPLQVMTTMVFFEVMMTKEAQQEEKVNELAAQNARAKQYNDALADLARLAEAFKSDASNTDKRETVKTDRQVIGEQAMKDWASLVQGKPTEIEVPNKDGVMEKKSIEGLGFEQRLDLLSAETKPPMSEAAKEALRGRARVADLAQEFGMLPGGAFSQGNTYANIAHGDPTKGTLETLKTKIRSAADAISSSNQLEMIKLQSYIGGSDAWKTAATKYVQTSADAQKEIVQKF